MFCCCRRVLGNICLIITHRFALSPFYMISVLYIYHVSIALWTLIQSLLVIHICPVPIKRIANVL